MIVVHHLNNSRSQRVLWLLEELGMPYEVRRYQRDPVTNLAPPELLQVHPLGKSPVISDGELTLAETAAIVEYLVDRGGGGLRPAAGTPEQLRYTYWLHFAEGSAMPPLLMALITARIRRAGPFFVRAITRRIADTIQSTVVTPNLERQFAFMEAELRERPWFAGPAFTAADVMMSFPLEAAVKRGRLDARFPKLNDWLARIHARPAYRAALEKGGRYDLLA